MTIDHYLEDLKDEIRMEEDGYVEYDILIKELFNKEFVPLTELDENRYHDIYSILRIPYGCLERDERVSVLELLISLCIRVSNSVIGDENPGKYFWDSLENLGLLELDDAHFSLGKFDIIVEKWLTKGYKKDGIGSPWPIKNCDVDLRKVDIWKHFCMYISANYA